MGRLLVIFAGLIGLLGGCASAPPGQTKPLTDLLTDASPTTFKAHGRLPPAEPSPVARSDWWTIYTDSVLNELVERANQGNTDIQIAASRLTHAKALTRQAGAARQPQLGLVAGVIRQEGPVLNAAGEEGTLVTASATLTFELDVLGRLAQTRDAASLDQQSRAALLDAARLLTQARVVQVYLSLRALDEEAAVLQQDVAADAQVLRIQAFRLRSGSVSEIEFQRLRSSSAITHSETLVLEQRRVELENTLAVLIGEAPSTFHFARDEWSAKLPIMPSVLPAQVLLRRPDITASRKNLLAAQKRLGVAQSAWFPTLALTGSGGFASADLSSLFNVSMQTWALGLLASVPVFDGGRREAAVAMADADLMTAAATYRSHVLGALREVEDQLSANRLLALRGEALQRAWDDAAKATALSAARFRSGSVSQVVQLDAERKELQIRRQLVQLRGSQYLASADLLRALGGGWQ